MGSRAESEPTPPAEGFRAPGGLVVVGQARSVRSARHLSLVLQAQGIAHAQAQHEGWTLLLVEPHQAEGARAELAAYERENHAWPPRADLPEVLSGGSLAAAAWSLTLLVCFFAQVQRAFGLDWVAQGRNDAALVRAGEWWRVITALTLHGDGGHLAANLVFGAGLLMLACQLLGTGLALLATLLAGALGNYLNVWVQSPGHTSIGASTAVFGALGLSMALVWMQRRGAARWRRLAPLFVGALFLAWFGTGGERTDVLAHFLGFAAGSVLGIARARMGLRVRLSQGVQLACGFAALLLLVLSWVLAHG